MKDLTKLRQQFEGEILWWDDQGFGLEEQDYEVMWQIFEKYNGVPIGLLQITIFEIRNYIENKSGSLKRNELEEQYKKLFSRDTEINAITFDTSNGPVTFKKGGIGFSLFTYPLYKAGQILIDHIPTYAELRRMSIDQFIRDHVKRLCSNSNLGPQEKRVVTGILYGHFKIFKRDPILTLKEYKQKYGTEKGYSDYLDNRIRHDETTNKNKIPAKFLKLLSSDLNIPDPRFKKGYKTAKK